MAACHRVGMGENRSQMSDCRISVRWIVTAALSAVLCAASTSGKPNLVVFLSDDHGAIDNAPYGAGDMRTPNMARLASAGLLFEQAFVNSPACAPSRATLLTGLYPARHGAEANHAKPHAALRKLPSFLQALGYEVVAFGKVSHYRYTKDYGFDHFAHDTFHDHAAIPRSDRVLGATHERQAAVHLCRLELATRPMASRPNDVLAR